MRRVPWRLLFGTAVIAAVSACINAPSSSASPLPSGPLMGFSTWYSYRTAATEADVLANANFLVSSGLAADGYRTVAIDDGWMAAQRNTDGSLTWDTAKFPDGIPWLAAQLHAMGLNTGIYEAIGTRTCQNFPGSWGHYAQDAQTFADWGIDVVKIDECGGLPTWENASYIVQQYQQYGTYLRQDNPAVAYFPEAPTYSMGAAPSQYYNADFLSEVQASSAMPLSSWGVAPNEYPLTHDNASPVILDHWARDVHLHGFAGTANGGHWNDLDMVAPGMPAQSTWTLSDLENQLSVWAVEASPLLVSADLTALSPAEVAALANPDMIAIDQSGTQSANGISSGSIEALVKPADGGQAVVFANTSLTSPESGTFTLAQVGISSARASGYQVWNNRTTAFSGIAVTLAPGQTLLIVMKGL